MWKWILGAAAATVAVGGIAYAATRTSSSSPASSSPAPWSLVQGHRYAVRLTFAQALDPTAISSAGTQTWLAAHMTAGAFTVVSVATSGNTATYTVDYSGPTTSFSNAQLQLGFEGATDVTVTDLGLSSALQSAATRTLVDSTTTSGTRTLAA